MVVVALIVLAFRAACVRGLGVRIYLASSEAEAVHSLVYFTHSRLAVVAD